MKTQIGSVITGDLKEGTITFEIEGEMELRAGKYAIVPYAEYKKQLNPFLPYTEATTLVGVYEVKTAKGEVIKCEMVQGDWFYFKGWLLDEDVVEYREIKH